MNTTPNNEPSAAPATAPSEMPELESVSALDSEMPTDRAAESASYLASADAAVIVAVKLVSTAATGYFYVKRRNPKKNPMKLEFMKYDPRVRRHVLFVEQKMK